jgi:hypothetical protein
VNDKWVSIENCLCKVLSVSFAATATGRVHTLQAGVKKRVDPPLPRKMHFNFLSMILDLLLSSFI